MLNTPKWSKSETKCSRQMIVPEAQITAVKRKMITAVPNCLLKISSV